jgi:hypothetical protein
MSTPEEYEHNLEQAHIGNARAMFQLAVHHNRRGDMEEAHKWFEKAANAGAIEARAYLGWVYKMNDLRDEAIYWTRMAAEDGSNDAKLMLETLLNPPDDLRPEIVSMAYTLQITGDAAASLGNWRQARDRWFRAADMGNVKAMTRIGRLEEDEGALGAAILWHERAALRGSDESMVRLAVIHSERGDESLAGEWYEVAAKTRKTAAATVPSGPDGEGTAQVPIQESRTDSEEQL